MPPGDPTRPASSSRPSDAPSAPVEIDPSQDLAAALHEVSNALTVLLGWVDAARSSADPATRSTALEVVASRASQARDIARRAIGGAAPPSLPALVSALVDDAVLGLAVEARRASVAFTVHVDARVSALALPASPALLQILTNLLLNALAFSPPGASVHVVASAAPPGDRVLIHVQDEGPGIPAEARERLFEAGVTSRRGGAGIGLRHSAALAARAGGQLRLGESDRGARFELFWPVSSDDSVAGGAPKSAERLVVDRPSIEGARILVIEDDDAVIELLEIALEARGASVVSVKARADLQKALQTGTFDAALLDMSPLLGDVGGAVAELHRASPGARLVVMSGSVAHADLGAAAVWVRKPFEVREIVEALGGSAAGGSVALALAKERRGAS